MPGSTEQMMVDKLRALGTESSSVVAAVLTSFDAMPLASGLFDFSEEETLCATAFALLAAGEKVTSDLSRGGIGQLYLRGERGTSSKVNDDAILACTVDHRAKMGEAFLEMSRCARK